MCLPLATPFPLFDSLHLSTLMLLSSIPHLAHYFLFYPFHMFFVALFSFLYYLTFLSYPDASKSNDFALCHLPLLFPHTYPIPYKADTLIILSLSYPINLSLLFQPYISFPMLSQHPHPPYPFLLHSSTFPYTLSFIFLTLPIQYNYLPFFALIPLPRITPSLSLPLPVKYNYPPFPFLPHSFPRSATHPRHPFPSTSAWADRVSAMLSSLYRFRGVLYWAFTICCPFTWRELSE